MGKNIKRRTIAFNLDNPMHAEEYKFSFSKKNFSSFGRELIRKEMERKVAGSKIILRPRRNAE